MENTMMLLKAIADDTRLGIVKLLLQHNYCVGALARRLELTEPAISQHLKVLREAGLIIGEKRGYFMHYYVDREQLRVLSSEIAELLTIQTEPCKPDKENCMQAKRNRCRAHEGHFFSCDCHKEINRELEK